ncbi:cytosine/adenosine deaminase-related metal-dependent hydrolase [Rhizobium sp. SJZ105]|uniref:amidohydrolase family protein n=1 Tax=Rhizobium sp. SJZ105 TaxID=2572678 RepID=UPI0011AD73F0|nr:amidohydrolase family protein [Rhizobium sp. SJZ105]TWC76440.1 cytosine/adenosine deaminase-related metal-dependent hydrolase [Rhizobium sp. SJZ105]
MSNLLISGGLVLCQDAERRELRADVLIEDGVITHIADVGAIYPLKAGETIDASNCAVLPGFVDTHRHTWQTALRGMAAGDSLLGYQHKIQGRFGAKFTPEDVYAGNLLGAFAAGQGGITTLCDESHVQNSPAHSDAAIAGLVDSKIRAVFDYGWPSVDAESWLRNSRREHPDYIRDILKDSRWNSNPLLSFQMMLRGPLMTPIDVTAQDIAFAREIGLRSVMHIIKGNIQTLADAGLLGTDLTFVHCCDSSDEELRLVAQSGGSISSSPNLELNMVGLGAPPIRRFVAAGIEPSLSIDVETSVAGDMFSTMRAALLSQTAEELYLGASEQRHLTPRDIIRFATINGARSCGLGDVTGSVEIGKRADLIMVRLDDLNVGPVDDAYAPDVIVASAHPGNVDTVIVDGNIVRRNGQPTDPALAARSIELATASRTRLLATASS